MVAHPSFLVVRRDDWHEDNAVLDAFKRHMVSRRVVMWFLSFEAMVLCIAFDHHRDL